MDKKAWVLRDYVIVTLIFSAIIALGYSMIISQAVEYDQTEIVNDNFNSSFNKFSERSAEVNEMLDEVDSEGGFQLLEAAELIFKSTFSIFGIIFQSLDDLRSQIADFGTVFGIPTEITSIALGLLLFVVISSIVFIIITSTSKSKL
ncbi:MAG: hypothetical protein R6U15_07560 [Candidatus Izemoplasmatales bacterium]